MQAGELNLELNKDKYLFGCTSIHFFGEIISWQDMNPDPRKVQVLTDMSPPKTKKELQLLQSEIIYPSKFSPMTV